MYILCCESMHEGPYHKQVMRYKSTPQLPPSELSLWPYPLIPITCMPVQAEVSQSALFVREPCCCSCKSTLRSCVSVQSRKGFVFIFKALFWRTRIGTLVLCSGTGFIGGFINPEELNQCCQLGNLRGLEIQLGFLEFSLTHGLVLGCQPSVLKSMG